MLDFEHEHVHKTLGFGSLQPNKQVEYYGILCPSPFRASPADLADSRCPLHAPRLAWIQCHSHQIDATIDIAYPLNNPNTVWSKTTPTTYGQHVDSDDVELHGEEEHIKIINQCGFPNRGL